MQITNSKKLYQKSTQFAPAGVHSPVRAFKAVGGNPIFFEKGEGAYLTDVDGNSFVDFCMCWGALALGHAHQEVVKALQEQLQKGTHFGTPTSKDVALAEEILSAVKIFDQVRFVNSGTEAVMTAIRLARGYTQKSKIVKFDGCYHGHSDSLLVSAGSGLMTQGLSSSAGVTKGSVDDTLVVKYPSRESVIEAFNKHGRDIAAIVIEPVLANSGLFEPEKDFLQFLQDIAHDHKSLLIFDEVITGFRIAWGGAVERYGLKPDIATYGKIIGGGLPVGAICSRNEIMNRLAPVGDVYQAGTLSGNPLCMAAGLATLKILKTSGFYTNIENEIGPYLDSKMAELQSRIPIYYKRVGSVFWICPEQSRTPVTPDDISKDAPIKFKAIYSQLLEKGLYLSPSVYEVSFLSLAHTRTEIDSLIDVLSKTLLESA